MGSGVPAKTNNKQNTAKSKGTHIEEKYGIKPEKLYQVDGAIYCTLEREDFKLSADILKGMEKYNNFSRDLDEEPVQK
jgi:hypothetical protein